MKNEKNFRIEKDLLGEKAVPVSAYYGIHTLRALENFQISGRRLSENPVFIRALIRVKKACALANLEIGALNPEHAAMILRACDEILWKDDYFDQFPTDPFQGGAGTSINMNANEVLANVGLELAGYSKGQYEYLHPHDHVNRSQSTNDVYPTALRLAIHESVATLLEHLRKLQNSLHEKAKEFETVLKMGRTQLQEAVPMTLGQEFGAFVTLIRDDRKHLSSLQEHLLAVNLGATAIGNGLNAPTGYGPLAVAKLREITGIPVVQSENLIAATSDCGDYVMISGGLKRLAVKLAKICNDLRLLASGPRAGFAEIHLPELQAGSSMMPAKVNPVIPEVVNQVCLKVIGNDVVITMAAEAGQLQLNVMGPLMAESLFESLLLLQNACIALAEKCVTGITADRERCLSYVMNSIGLVTLLNPFIGHEAGDRVGRICSETGKSVREVVLELGLLNSEKLDEVFSLENILRLQKPVSK